MAVKNIDPNNFTYKQEDDFLFIVLDIRKNKHVYSYEDPQDIFTKKKTKDILKYYYNYLDKFSKIVYKYPQIDKQKLCMWLLNMHLTNNYLSDFEIKKLISLFPEFKVELDKLYLYHYNTQDISQYAMTLSEDIVYKFLENNQKFVWGIFNDNLSKYIISKEKQIDIIKMMLKNYYEYDKINLYIKKWKPHFSAKYLNELFDKELNQVKFEIYKECLTDDQREAFKSFIASKFESICYNVNYDEFKKYLWNEVISSNVWTNYIIKNITNKEEYKLILNRCKDLLNFKNKRDIMISIIRMIKDEQELNNSKELLDQLF